MLINRSVQIRKISSSWILFHHFFLFVNNPKLLGSCLAFQYLFLTDSRGLNGLNLLREYIVQTITAYQHSTPTKGLQGYEGSYDHETDMMIFRKIGKRLGNSFCFVVVVVVFWKNHNISIFVVPNRMYFFVILLVHLKINLVSPKTSTFLLIIIKNYNIAKINILLLKYVETCLICFQIVFVPPNPA